MKRSNRRSTATASILVALLITSTAGLADTAVACVCPDGQVEIEAATICSCCNPVNSDDHGFEAESAFESQSCNDCVDVPLRVPFAGNEPHQRGTETVQDKNQSSPSSHEIGCEDIRPSRPDQGHRLNLALLSSVVLLT